MLDTTALPEESTASTVAAYVPDLTRCPFELFRSQAMLVSPAGSAAPEASVRTSSPFALTIVTVVGAGVESEKVTLPDLATGVGDTDNPEIVSEGAGGDTGVGEGAAAGGFVKVLATKSAGPGTSEAAGMSRFICAAVRAIGEPSSWR